MQTSAAVERLQLQVTDAFIVSRVANDAAARAVQVITSAAANQLQHAASTRQGVNAAPRPRLDARGSRSESRDEAQALQEVQMLRKKRSSAAVAVLRASRKWKLPGGRVATPSEVLRRAGRLRHHLRHHGTTL